MKEEIGVTDVELAPVYKFMYKAYCNEKYGEHEFDQVYVGKYNTAVVPNKEEVSEVAWVDINQLIKQINVDTSITSPDQTLIMNLEELKKNTAPCEVEIDGAKQLLAPWTYMMLKNDKLTQALKNDLTTENNLNVF